MHVPDLLSGSKGHELDAEPAGLATRARAWRICSRCIWVGLLALALTPSKHAAAKGPSKVVRAGNRAHPRLDIAWGRAVTTVPVPMAEVLRVVSDYNNYSTIIPRCSKSLVLAQQGMNATVYLQAKPRGLSASFWVQVKVRHKEQGQKVILEARKTRGNVDVALARWELLPTHQGKQTRIAFQILFKPSFPFPSNVLSKYNRTTARTTLRSVRRQLMRKRQARSTSPS